MAVVRPLHGLRYDAAKVGDLGRVLAPPYDVISRPEQEELYGRSPHNVVRLILPKDADRAAAAARQLRAWVDARALVADDLPAVYLYSQRFTLADGTSHRRDGVMCRLRLEDFASGVVRPHERTLPGPKEDRLKLFRATGANLSPIFGLYSRPGERVRDLLGAAVAGPPAVDVDGWHQLWPVTDPATVARFQEALAHETIFIADGHHRYETALAYRDENPGVEPARWVLAYLANMEEEGVVILPTHRLVPRPLRLAPDALEARLREAFTLSPSVHGKRGDGEIDVVLPDRCWRLAPRPEVAATATLDVALLHGAILEPLLGLTGEDLEFTHDDLEAIEAVEQGRAHAAFLLNAPTMHDVRDVCLAGEVMPQKSTYFYPKLATGLVISLVGPPWV